MENQIQSLIELQQVAELQLSSHSSHLLCESDSIDWEDIGSILALGEGHLDRFRQH